MNADTDQPTITPDAVPRGAVVLGRFGAGRLGDTLCTSPLPRLIRAARGSPVYVQDDPVIRAVFAANPHVAGFVAGPVPGLESRIRGEGHVIQRLQQGLGLAVEPLPRPEVYLTAAERAWAAAERAKWPAGRPACVLSTAALTDSGNAARVDWWSVVELLGRWFTVVQPVVSEAPMPGTIAYRDLPVRLYMALVAQADYFVGATSGGSHVAAAFDVPALVVSWREMLESLRFPVSGLGLPLGRDSFLYPQQWHVAAEDWASAELRNHRLPQILAEMQARGRAGRETAAVGNSAAPCGFIPWRPRPVLRMRQRFVRMPAELT
jgi:hypothetical protein